LIIECNISLLNIFYCCKDLSEDKAIPLRASVELRDGKWILLSKEQGGRMVMVQMVES
jgi:hypothetical protein